MVHTEIQSGLKHCLEQAKIGLDSGHFHLQDAPDSAKYLLVDTVSGRERSIGANDKLVVDSSGAPVMFQKSLVFAAPGEDGKLVPFVAGLRAAAPNEFHHRSLADQYMNSRLKFDPALEGEVTKSSDLLVRHVAQALSYLKDSTRPVPDGSEPQLERILTILARDGMVRRTAVAVAGAATDAGSSPPISFHDYEANRARLAELEAQHEAIESKLHSAQRGLWRATGLKRFAPAELILGRDTFRPMLDLPGISWIGKGISALNNLISPAQRGLRGIAAYQDELGVVRDQIEEIKAKGLGPSRQAPPEEGSRVIGRYEFSLTQKGLDTINDLQDPALSHELKREGYSLRDCRCSKALATLRAVRAAEERAELEKARGQAKAAARNRPAQGNRSNGAGAGGSSPQLVDTASVPMAAPNLYPLEGLDGTGDLMGDDFFPGP